ncbi:hypothetical protein ARALYDRAFT_917693 [Arabidopsis lyrata subsp. lyrata]|uniref:Uncharacterized protein n=1 Tax=Arabidopsis lyrata subsp. lyrata TaxID=81972 RepID=D7ML18_ARALL|nr:hypothetical protein ARALYDRAFT_917693 [Arabidopsis lyrata subsp. lyrata]
MKSPSLTVTVTAPSIRALFLQSCSKTHGSTLRVAYQGVPSVYFEATTGKAYPKSEDIRCDQFDVAFQAVELWIADRLVLPIET